MFCISYRIKFKINPTKKSNKAQSMSLNLKKKKLVGVGVGPWITDPPLTSSTNLWQKINKKNLTPNPWHLTPDTWHVTPDTWHATCDTRHVTYDIWHMMVGEHSLKISASQLFWFGIDNVLKIMNKSINYSMIESMNESMNDKSVWTAPSTPGLLNTVLALVPPYIWVENKGNNHINK